MTIDELITDWAVSTRWSRPMLQGWVEDLNDTAARRGIELTEPERVQLLRLGVTGHQVITPDALLSVWYP